MIVKTFGNTNFLAWKGETLLLNNNNLSNTLISCWSLENKWYNVGRTENVVITEYTYSTILAIVCTKYIHGRVKRQFFGIFSETPHGQ